jgi:RNA polymerase sigma factor (sigma-70 family)
MSTMTTDHPRVVVVTVGSVGIGGETAQRGHLADGQPHNPRLKGASTVTATVGDRRESDELLLEGFCAGDEECAGMFMQHFWRRLCSIAFRIVGDSGSAEDVVQVAFERAWRNGVTFDPQRGSLDAWMTTIARNVALDWVRMKRAIPTDPSKIHASATPGSCEPEDWSGREESRAEVRSALTSLSPILARSIVLAAAFDMTAAEVARFEHVPLGTAKSRIRAAKQCLRKEMNARR